MTSACNPLILDRYRTIGQLKPYDIQPHLVCCRLAIPPTLSNIGSLHAKQGKIADAEAVYLRALAGFEKAGGPDHTFTLKMLSNLGAICSRQGKVARLRTCFCGL